MFGKAFDVFREESLPDSAVLIAAFLWMSPFLLAIHFGLLEDSALLVSVFWVLIGLLIGPMGLLVGNAFVVALVYTTYKQLPAEFVVMGWTVLPVIFFLYWLILYALQYRGRGTNWDRREMLFQSALRACVFTPIGPFGFALLIIYQSPGIAWFFMGLCILLTLYAADILAKRTPRFWWNNKMWADKNTRPLMFTNQ